MAKEEVESILVKVLFYFQLGLGLWQFIKLTPVGAVIQGTIGWLLQPFGLSPAYSLLHKCPGHVFKKVKCIKMLPTDETSTLDETSGLDDNIRASYLGVPFHLERKGRNMLVENKMAYYITDVNWYYLHLMGLYLNANENENESENENENENESENENENESENRNVVFLKSYKQFWEQVATGRVLSLVEVLDCLILDNYDFRGSHYNDSLLPVNLSVSEEKLLKVINLAGLFLQTRKAYGGIATGLSLTSAVLEFIPAVRVWIYGEINRVFCRAMHFICDKLSYSRRKQVYSLGNWVENLKPSNDMLLKVVKGDVVTVIGGGAKITPEAPFVESPMDVPEQTGTFRKRTFRVVEPPMDIECHFNAVRNVAKISLYTGRDRNRKRIGNQFLRCEKGFPDFLRICTFISQIAEKKCGSLKSHGRDKKCGSLKCHGPDNKVHVRSLMDSTICYVLNHCPPVYLLTLNDVVVQ